ncbi:MAG: hypothetical protein U0792_04970, partial [Gemmataceae bacterium]
MRVLPFAVFVSLVAAIAATPTPAAPPAGEYVKKGNRADTIRATLASHDLPNLEGKWYFVGPFDNDNGEGFDRTYPPEKGVDLKATYSGKDGTKIAWEEFKGFVPGKVTDLKTLTKANTNAAIYLYHAFESSAEFKQQLAFGSDDTLSVYFNGK